MIWLWSGTGMLFQKDKPIWDQDGADWPLRAFSRFVPAAGLRWHVQVMGQGPVVLLLHGTAAASHSWRDVAPRLSDRFTLVIPDLPGHGFTDNPRHSQLSLPGMSRAVRALCTELDLAPQMIVGHSAGAAIAVHMALSQPLGLRGLVSFNGALLPFKGVAGHLFPVMAKLLAFNPLVPYLAAVRARDLAAVRKQIRGTGSDIDDRGLELYHRLAQRKDHLASTLSMMANWDLEPLGRRLPKLDLPVMLVAGDKDRAVPPGDADQLAEKLPNAQVVRQPGLGHLSHEEAPDEAAALIEEQAALCGLIETRATA